MPVTRPQKIYYAHALCVYRYPHEAQSLEQIAARFPHTELVNPGAYGYFPAEFSFFKGLVAQCKGLVFERLYGKVTLGVGGEIRHALERKKEVYELTEEGQFLPVAEPPDFCDWDETKTLYSRWRAEHGVRKIALLVPKADYAQIEEQGAEWNEREQVWLWPSHEPLELVAGWLPRLERRRAQPPYLLSGMVPASMWGQNLRSLFRERWKKLSREIRAQYGHRCQICGGPSMGCHEDWEYVYDASASSGHGIQRLREVVSLCEGCHSVEHLGRTESLGQLEAAMQHWAFVNGWPLKKAYTERIKTWADWSHRNRFRWTLDLSWVERKYGWPTQAMLSQREQPLIAATQALASPRQPTIYYAHAYCTYGTSVETGALERLSREFPGAKIVNPAPFRWQEELAYSRVDPCDLLVFSRLLGEITGGVGLKVNYALRGGKPVLNLPESGPYLMH
jgi:hypothetical protein